MSLEAILIIAVVALQLIQAYRVETRRELADQERREIARRVAECCVMGFRSGAKARETSD